MSRKKADLKSLIVCLAFVLPGLALILSGCGSENMEQSPEQAAGSPRSHLWDKLHDAGEEPPGYALYTYVLINRSKADTAAWKRYENLVEAIMDSTTAASDHGPDFDRSLYNLFLIPYRAGGPQQEEGLNDILSKSILTSLAASVQRQEMRDLINTHPGPFLISAAEPISHQSLSKEIDMLYVDLTRTNIDAMPEVVSAYKKRLTSGSIADVERFTSIRLALLNIILDADDYISLVKVAYAGWIKD